MNEKKFKVGDRVRYINPIPHYLEDYIERGDECIVSEITDCGYYVTKTCESLTIESDELELIESTDPRTAFLQELKELLNRHNAKITFAFRTETRETGIAFEIGDDKENLTWYPLRMDELDPDPAIIWQMPGCNYPLTPDNIMDYEKE